MDTKGSTKANRHLSVAGIPIVSVFLAAAAVAAEDDLEAGIVLGVSHIDNVFLAPPPDEVDDIVYRVSPFIQYSRESQRLDTRLDYVLNWYDYSDTGLSSTFHTGTASVTAKALQNGFTLELGARRMQVLSDPDGVIPDGLLPLSGNLTDRDEFWGNPRLTRELGQSVTFEADYRYTFGRYGDRFQEDRNQQATVKVENYRAADGLTWALSYDWRRTDYEISESWEYQRATAELGYWTSASTRLFAAGGEESAWDEPFDAALADPFWEVGFSYKSGDKVTAEFAGGERSFGTSWRGDIDYTFRRGRMALSYVEGVSTTGFSRVTLTVDEGRPGELDDFLNQPGSAERFLQKRLQWTLDLSGRKTSFLLRVFNEDRTDRVTADGGTRADQSQAGVRVDVSWRAGARTTLIVDGALGERENGDLGESRFTAGGLAADYQIGRRTSLTLSYRYTEEQPRGTASLGRDYVSNMVSLLLTFSI